MPSGGVYITEAGKITDTNIKLLKGLYIKRNGFRKHYKKICTGLRGDYMAIAAQVDIKEAIRLYYSTMELSNSDIRRMFGGKVGSTRMQTLKRLAREKASEMEKPVFDAVKVNTEAAFEAWGFNIEELERKYQKLRKLGFA